MFKEYCALMAYSRHPARFRYNCGMSNPPDTSPYEIEREIPSPISIGDYTAWVAPSHDCAMMRDWLCSIRDDLSGGNVLAEGRHRVARVEGPDKIDWVVKSFGRQVYLKDRLDVKRGTKAYRSFTNALYLERRGVGTPAPVACLERWAGGRLAESHFISQYEPDLISFRDELIRLYRHQPLCEKIMALLEVVARSVARLHDSGMFHRDMGNQNILLRRDSGGSWSDVLFIDLNRARRGDPGDMRARAFDISRITLPSDFLRIFKAMIFSPEIVPSGLNQWESFYRSRFAVHTWTRALRHPVRTARRRRAPTDPAHTYPFVRDIWIWDERSAQAISTLLRKDRKRFYSFCNTLKIADAVAVAVKPVRREYRAVLETAFKQPVDWSGRIGVAVHPRPASWERERALLAGLGPLPVLVRFYHHETEVEWGFTDQCLRELAQAGHPVSLALVQDRRAVQDPQSWNAFVHRVMEAWADTAEWVEIGHAINRVKWGIWTLDEYVQLCAPFRPYAQGTRHCRLAGPAVIDFEYAFLVGALKRLEGVLRFDALSHHLYVDRRGAPENLQAGFGVLEKCALARAIAAWAPTCAPRLIVSEVNWPLSGTGVWSPVNSPYLVPGPRRNDPGVTEDAYADYMLRYLLWTLASGFVERVYWWRLMAHGFGLADDQSANGIERPAYRMLKNFLRKTVDTRFEKKWSTPEGAHAFLFRNRNGTATIWIFAHPAATTYAPTFEYDELLDAFGERIGTGSASAIPVTGRPVCLLGSMT